MRPTTVGLFVGILLGMTWVLAGFLEMIGVAICGAIGVIVMKVIEGEIDITDYVGNAASSRRRS